MYRDGEVENARRGAGASMDMAKAVRTGERRAPTVTIRVDGQAVEAVEGEMLAAALMAAGFWRLRASPRLGAPRGAFCLMGVCQECAIHVGGRLAQACMTAVSEGLEVELRGVP